jgi:predicted nuclease with TOPRIM domain
MNDEKQCLNEKLDNFENNFKIINDSVAALESQNSKLKEINEMMNGEKQSLRHKLIAFEGQYKLLMKTLRLSKQKT